MLILYWFSYHLGDMGHIGTPPTEEIFDDFFKIDLGVNKDSFVNILCFGKLSGDSSGHLKN